MNIKQRYDRNDYWIYGKHAVIAALTNQRRYLGRLLLTHDTLTTLKQELPNYDLSSIDMMISTTQGINYACGYRNASTQGIALKTKQLIQPTFEVLLQNLPHNGVKLVLLDHITDPNNIGAIIRSAVAFGIHAVIITKNNSPAETASMVKAAAGAFELIPLVQVVNLRYTINILKKYSYWVLGLDCTAQHDIAKINTDFPNIAFIFGSEEDGLRKLIKESCDLLLKIKISSKIDSLNVASSVAIALHAVNCNQP